MRCGAYAGTADGAAFTCEMEVDALHPCRVHGVTSNDAAMDPRETKDRDSGDPARERVPYGTLVTGPTPPLNHRASLLFEAEALVNGDRNAQYGDPRQDFVRTATMWGAYLGIEIQAHDVAALMVLLKASRIRWSPTKRDSWVDLAGYAACGWHCAAPDDVAP